MKEPGFRKRLSQIEVHLAEMETAAKHADHRRAFSHADIIRNHIIGMRIELDRKEIELAVLFR